jgi:DNA-binding transcriptional ArsR family regulator
MSVTWMAWVWQQQCPNAGIKLTLLALADHAGEDGTAFPGCARLGEKTGQDERTIRRHLDTLEEMGLLTRERRRRQDGTLGTYTYTLQNTTGQLRPLVVDARHQRTPMSGSPADTDVRAEPSVSKTSVEPSVLCIDAFETFWVAYGKVGPKKKARECWLKALAKTGGDPEPILQGVRAWREYWDTPGAANVKWPQGWLNEERWNDQPPAVQGSSSKNGRSIEAILKVTGAMQ